MALAAGPTPAPQPCAPAPETEPLVATTSYPGYITLNFFYAQGQPVDFYECVGGRARYLGRRASPGDDITVFGGAATWRCDRLDRRFAATTVLPDGTRKLGRTAVRTRSCTDRFELRVPRQVARGRTVQVHLVDTWNLGGVTPRLCIAPPGRRGWCRPVRFPQAVNVELRQLRLSERGLWRFTVRIDGRSEERTVAVGVPAPRVVPMRTVVAAGDSTMMGTEAFLADDVRRTTMWPATSCRV